VRQQRVFVDQMRVGVEGDRGDLVATIERGAVERLDVGQDLIDDDAAGVDVAARVSEELDRVV
jgi:hypothetical protein